MNFWDQTIIIRQRADRGGRSYSARMIRGPIALTMPTEAMPPEAHRLMAENDAGSEQQILDVTQRQRERNRGLKAALRDAALQC